MKLDLAYRFCSDGPIFQPLPIQILYRETGHRYRFCSDTRVFRGPPDTDSVHLLLNQAGGISKGLVPGHENSIKTGLKQQAAKFARTDQHITEGKS